MHIRVVLIVALGTLCACSSVPPAPAHEILDEQSGNTLLVVAKPLVFARARTDVAAYARDYATLVALEVDQSGKYSQFLLLYRWSTVDRRMSSPPDPLAGELRILAEGRSIDLMPLEQIPVSLSRRRELYLPDRGDVVAHAYAVDAATLRFIASSRDLSVQMPQERLDTPFTVFEDGRKALGQFVQRVEVP
jgi:hypothetical protein